MAKNEYGDEIIGRVGEEGQPTEGLRNEFGDLIIGTAPDFAKPRSMSVMGGDEKYSPLAEAVRGGVRSLTFGLSQPAEAGVRSLFSDKTFSQEREGLREREKAYEKDFGGTKLATETALGFAPFGILAKTKLGQSMMTSPTMGGQIAKNAGLGAAGGGLYAATEAENAGQILPNAVGGAIVGGAVGGSAPTVFNALAKASGNVARALGFTGDAEKRGRQLLLQNIQREGLTPEGIQKTLSTLRSQGVPDPVIADLGDNLRGLAFSAYAQPNANKTQAAQFLQGRSQGATSTASGQLQVAAGLSDSKVGFDYITDLASKQSELARKSYPEAYSQAIPSTPFRKYFDRKVFQDAYQKAADDAAIEGIEMPMSFDQIKSAQFLPTDVLHQMKRGLDKKIEENTNDLGKVNTTGRVLIKVKNEFNDLIKEYNPEYAKANAEFADSARLTDSYKLGSIYNRKDPKELEATLKRMTPAEKEAFRVGFVSEVQNSLAKSRQADPESIIFKSDRQKDVLRLAFPDEAGFKQFQLQLAAMNQQARTSQKVMGGSPTKERDIIAADSGEGLQVAETLGDVGRGNFGQALSRALSFAKGLDEKTSAVLTRDLLSPDPKVQQDALFMVENLQKMAGQPRANIQGTYAGGLGTVSSGLLF